MYRAIRSARTGVGIGMWIAISFLIALACRIRLNRGQKTASPDEGHYMRYASTWRPGKTYQRLVADFLASSKLQIPPTRYVFFAICAAVVGLIRTPVPYRTLTWIASLTGAAAAPVAYAITHSMPAALLVATSPLSLLLGRKALQDTTSALTVLLGLWAIYAQNPWCLGISVLVAIGSREALLLYIPALSAAWGLRTGDWILGGGVLMAGTLGSVGIFYLLGGRNLGAIFRKLSKPTDYVLRVQAGSPHRVLIDQMFVSPVTTVGALVACPQAPTWLVGFVAGALLVHAFVIPKNVRFMLAVDLGMRILCASLPGFAPWVVLGLGVISDVQLYRAFYSTNDPVTYDLVLKTKMFVPPEVKVFVRD